MLSRKSLLQLFGLGLISPRLLGAQTEAPTDEAWALMYLRRVNAAQVTYGSIKGRHTDRIEELSSVTKLPEPPAGWRLTIAVHDDKALDDKSIRDDKWDLVMLQQAKDAIIFVTDQTGMIRRGIISPIRPATPRQNQP